MVRRGRLWAASTELPHDEAHYIHLRPPPFMSTSGGCLIRFHDPAAALPGGYIIVFTGLKQAVGTEDEMAAVIGHELGHVFARHSAERLTLMALVQGVLLTLAVMGFPVNVRLVTVLHKADWCAAPCETLLSTLGSALVTSTSLRPSTIRFHPRGVTAPNVNPDPTPFLARRRT